MTKLTEEDEKKILADWGERFKTLSTELNGLIKETGDAWVQKKKAEFEKAKGKHALEFPRVCFFKPAEVLVFQPSITGLSGGVTGLNLSLTGVSFAYTLVKSRNGGAGFEPSVVDNSDKIMASRLCGNRLEADMTKISKVMQSDKIVLTAFKSALQTRQTALLHQE